ncbi:MAG: HU family DNA-binding protein [Bdellovibrio sp.]|nr:MAG: HU family DNA-binding protein [Bdellovibrio sp.]
MNKAQLIEKLSQRTKLTKTQTETILDATLEIIQESVVKGEDVKLVGFGIFDKAVRKQRNGRNPKTGETIVIPETIVPRFRPGKDFKNLVQKQKS